MYYRSTATGKILSEGSVKILNDIFGGDTVSSMVTDGLLWVSRTLRLSTV